MKPKLLFVVNIDRFFISHRLPIALEAIEEGFEVHLATSVTGALDHLLDQGIHVHPLKIDRRSTGIISNILIFWQFFRLFRRLRPDIVHLVTIKPTLLGGIAARCARVPAVVVAISGLGFTFIAQGVKARLRRCLISFLYRLALNHKRRCVIFQNKDDQNTIMNMTQLPNNVCVLIRGSGVDLSIFTPRERTQRVPRVVLPARLLTDKGVREFVSAARAIKKQGTDAQFVLVGEMDPGNPATIRSQELNAWVEEGVIVHDGYREDMHTVFAEASFVVLPSYREGLPKALIEAAACGRAVITTDVPGCRDAIENGVTGLLVPVRDALRLADAMSSLLNDPVRCKQLGDAGRQLAEAAFDVNAVVSAHIQLYSKLL